MTHHKCSSLATVPPSELELHYVQVPFNIFTYLSSVKYVLSTQIKPRKLLPDLSTQLKQDNISLLNLLLKVGLVTFTIFANMRRYKRKTKLSLASWTFDLISSPGTRSLPIASEILSLSQMKCNHTSII